VKIAKVCGMKCMNLSVSSAYLNNSWLIRMPSYLESDAVSFRIYGVVVLGFYAFHLFGPEEHIQEVLNTLAMLIF
jgi:hypothetical protein